MEMNFGQMKILLGMKITSVGRIFLENEEDSYPLMDTLFLRVDNETVLQLLRINQVGLITQFCLLKDRPLINSAIELEPEEKVTARDLTIEGLNFPVNIFSILEFWAGSKGKEFLIGFILYGDNRKVLLSIYTETDEIELLNYNEFYKRIETLPFYYGTVLTHCYEKP
jgi:hypothetical protein